jgi:SpoVK/Ycf46/Vps4 family AAA+-type ATPase
MDDAIDAIRRELIIPLASPDISKSVGEDPQSVLMIGVPGTGKTLVAERLLQEDTGLFILPIDPFELQKELMQPKEKQRLMPRIAEVSRVTGRRVILHVDDIENMVGEDEHTNSTLLTLMAGVQESGFYIMASTNYPEKINPSLIQPQRFSVLLHCGLQSEKARYEILKIHADMESKEKGMPLFSTEEVRDIILSEVAAHSNNFTPRYMANIATIAKSYLIDRVSKDKGRIIGLTEEDLEGYAFDVVDWEKAFAEVSSKYDSESVRKRDEQLRKFVKKHGERLGFVKNEAAEGRIFSQDVFARIVAAEARIIPNASTVEEK